MRNPLIRIDRKIKRGLDEKKLYPNETYDSVLRRLLPKTFVSSFWGSNKNKKGSFNFSKGGINV